MADKLEDLRLEVTGLHIEKEGSCRKIASFLGFRKLIGFSLVMWYLPYNKNLKTFSRHLRNNSTLGEVLLWQQLKAGQVRGYKFNRQKPLGRYIVDFYCKRLNLVIEVDGGYHFQGDQPLRDKARQEVLESMALQFLRFDDADVKQNISFVVRAIHEFVEEWERMNPPDQPKG